MFNRVSKEMYWIKLLNQQPMRLFIYDLYSAFNSDILEDTCQTIFVNSYGWFLMEKSWEILCKLKSRYNFWIAGRPGLLNKVALLNSHHNIILNCARPAPGIRGIWTSVEIEIFIPYLFLRWSSDRNRSQISLLISYC